jgi:plastocyanin
MRPIIVSLSLLLLAGVNATAGSISGVVKFTGEKPAPKVLSEMLANSFCKDHCGGKPPVSDRVVFGKNGSDDVVANVLVYVSKGLEGKKFEAPKEPVVIDQVNCIYVPHVVAVMAGQPLEIKNSDETLHNVMTRPRENAGFNDGMPGKGKILTKVFTKPELGVDLRCFMHPWMLGYVHVMDHPYYSISSTNGTFEIKNLPPGTYDIAVKHEWSRFEPAADHQTVTVGDADDKKIEFSYRLRSL